MTANMLNTHAHKEMHIFVFDGAYGKYGIWMKKLYVGWVESAI